MSIILLSTGPQKNFTPNNDYHWYHESPFLPIHGESRDELGAPSLRSTAIRKILEDQSVLKPEMFEHVPWPIALGLWEYLGHHKKQTLRMWKIMATIYPREFLSLSPYYGLLTKRPMQPLKGYINIMASTKCDWRAVLSLSTSYATIEDLGEIRTVQNLVALEISNTSWHPHKYSSLASESKDQLEDGIIRTWVETPGSLQHLRVLRLYNQPEIKPAVLQHLIKLPSLQLIVINQCDGFTKDLSHARKSSSGKLEIEGWNVLTLDRAGHNKIQDQRVMDALGPLLEVYRGTLDTQPKSDGLEIPHSPPSLGSDVPIMEFGLPIVDHDDEQMVEIRSRYSAKAIAILTRAPTRSTKHPLRPTDRPRERTKRVMKDKGARDMADLLSDFF